MPAATADPMIVVSVRNLAGDAWGERWTPDKLAYFILMSNLDAPKFENSLRTEWVPFDRNAYRWEKGRLDRAAFDALAAHWPGRDAVPFDRGACDRVQFAYPTPRGAAGSGFMPADEPELFDALTGGGIGPIAYEEFAYDAARHVFRADLGRAKVGALLRAAPGIRAALKRVAPEMLAKPFDDAPGARAVRFLCRHGTFENPITLWFEA